MRLILASASPRRRELLSAAGVAFELDPADIDESTDETDPVVAATSLAERKALATATRHGREEGLFVLGADTVVAVEVEGAERLLGKPRDPDEARRMLSWLSGSVQRVVTGIAVCRPADGTLSSDHELTRVSMRPITPAEIEAYVASGEWQGKAGGYAIQETADRFVTGLEGGGFENVVGLPVERTLALLRRAGGSF